MHLSSVLLPEPLRPTSPKNSPLSTWKETFFSESKVLRSRLRRGCRARSLSVCMRSAGSENFFETSSMRSAGRLDCTAESLCAMPREQCAGAKGAPRSAVAAEARKPSFERLQQAPAQRTTDRGDLPRTLDQLTREFEVGFAQFPVGVFGFA